MKYFIFGAGGTGIPVLEMHCNEYDITGFCDNNPAMQGTKCWGLPVIAPEQLKGRDDIKVIIPPGKTHFDKAQQLFKLGIKDFYLVRPNDSTRIAYIDLSRYDDITPKPNRIWIRNYGNHAACSNTRALVEYNPYDDIEIIVSNKYNMYGDGEGYYVFHTSALVITQCAEFVFDKPRIELFHGFPVKAIHYGSNDEHAQDEGFANSKKMNNKYTVIASYSKLYNIFFGYCMRVPKEKFVITGMPRNDLLLRCDAAAKMRDLLGNVRQKHIALYAPTFRKADTYGYEGIQDGYFFSWDDYNQEDFEEFLKEHDILLIVKLHKAELLDVPINESEYIKVLKDDDFAIKDIYLYEMLGATCLLITDYSSLAVDYLLLDKPIVYAVRDIDEYEEKHGLMTQPFDAWAAGETARGFDSLKAAIENALSGADVYKNRRTQMRQIMHKHCDAHSSKRVLDLARGIMGLTDAT